MRKIAALTILLIISLLAVDLYCDQADIKVMVKVLGTIPQNPDPGIMTKMALRVTNDGSADIPADSKIYLRYAVYGKSGSSEGSLIQKCDLKSGESFDLETGGNTRSAGDYTFIVEELTISNNNGRNIIVQLIRPVGYRFRVGSGRQDTGTLSPSAENGLNVSLGHDAIKSIGATKLLIPQSKNVMVEARIDKEIVRGKDDLHAEIKITNVGKTFITLTGGESWWDTDTPYVKMVQGSGRAGAGKLVKLDPGETYEDAITLFVTDTAKPGPLRFSIKSLNVSACSDPITILNLSAAPLSAEIKDFFSYFNHCADENFSKVKEGMTIEEVRESVGGTKYVPYGVPRSIDFIPFRFYLDSTPAYEVGFANRPEGINDFFVSEKNVMNVKYYDDGKVKASMIFPKEKIRIKTTGGVFDAKVI